MRACCALVHWFSAREALVEVQWREKKIQKFVSSEKWERERESERMGLRERKALSPCVCVLGLSFCGNTGKQKPLSARGKLSWCNLDVVFQARGSSREKRLRQQYTYSTHRLLDGQGEASGWLMVYICIGYMWSKLQQGQDHHRFMRNKPGAGGYQGTSCNWFVVGVRGFWGAKLSRCSLTDFQNKIQSGMDVRGEGELHCTISSAKAT